MAKRKRREDEEEEACETQVNYDDGGGENCEYWEEGIRPTQVQKASVTTAKTETEHTEFWNHLSQMLVMSLTTTSQYYGSNNSLELLSYNNNKSEDCGCGNG